MKNRLLMFLFAGVLCVGLTPATAFAKGPGEGHGRGDANHVDRGRDGGDPHGWSKGKKKGWHGEDEPPGLEKKEHHASRGVHHNTHRTYHHPATTNRHYPSTATTKPNTTTATKTTKVRRPVDYKDHDVRR